MHTHRRRKSKEARVKWIGGTSCRRSTSQQLDRLDGDKLGFYARGGKVPVQMSRYTDVQSARDCKHRAEEWTSAYESPLKTPQERDLRRRKKGAKVISLVAEGSRQNSISTPRKKKKTVFSRTGGKYSNLSKML